MITFIKLSDSKLLLTASILICFCYESEASISKGPNLKYLGNIGNDIFYNRSTTNPAAFAISATFS
jgi:hypothetical protein